MEDASNQIIRENKGKYTCDICPRTFTRKDRLDRHISYHTGIKTFHCENCEKSYSNKAHLQRHKKIHVNTPKINSYVCKYQGCMQGFTNKSNRNRHYKINHAENPLKYECNECDNVKYPRRDQLRRHLVKVHSIAKYSYECDKCGNGYFDKYTYLKHVKSHEGKVCKICQEEFINWTQLVAHRRSVHSKKMIKATQSFECDLCGKVFCMKLDIRRHMRIHELKTKDIVHSCNYENCSKFYAQKRNLLAHIKSKHEGKNFHCNLCNLKLSTNQKLQQHLIAHNDPIKSKHIKIPKISLLLGIKFESEQKSLSHRIDEISATESEVSDYL